MLHQASRTVPQVAFGLRIESDIPIDGLPAASGDEIAVVHVHEDDSLRASRDTAADAEIELQGHPLQLFVNGGLELRWGERAYYRIGVTDPEIRCSYGPAGNLGQMRQWLLQCVLPLHAVIRRHLGLLHGGSVQVAGQAIGFLAPSGVGKSTLVEHFVERGHGFLTDDKLAIVRRDGQYFSVPSTPFLCTDDAKMHWKSAPNYVRGMMPLAALYLLTPVAPLASPAIEPVDPARAPFELSCHSELSLPQPVRDRLGLSRPGLDGFASCCDLASRVPVKRLLVPRALSRLAEVYDTVLADVENSR